MRGQTEDKLWFSCWFDVSTLSYLHSVQYADHNPRYASSCRGRKPRSQVCTVSSTTTPFPVVTLSNLIELIASFPGRCGNPHYPDGSYDLARLDSVCRAMLLALTHGVCLAVQTTKPEKIFCEGAEKNFVGVVKVMGFNATEAAGLEEEEAETSDEEKTEVGDETSDEETEDVSAAVEDAGTTTDDITVDDAGSTVGGGGAAEVRRGLDVSGDEDPLMEVRKNGGWYTASTDYGVASNDENEKLVSLSDEELVVSIDNLLETANFFPGRDRRLQSTQSTQQQAGTSAEQEVADPGKFDGLALGVDYTLLFLSSGGGNSTASAEALKKALETTAPEDMASTIRGFIIEEVKKSPRLVAENVAVGEVRGGVLLRLVAENVAVGEVRLM